MKAIAWGSALDGALMAHPAPSVDVHRLGDLPLSSATAPSFKLESLHDSPIMTLQ
jgi:hypothetical protein